MHKHISGSSAIGTCWRAETQTRATIGECYTVCTCITTEVYVYVIRKYICGSSDIGTFLREESQKGYYR
jgi:hypothetical protein